MTPTVVCVVDTSVGIKLFLTEELPDRADAIFAHQAADRPGHFSVPDLSEIDCAHTFMKARCEPFWPLRAANP
jgi:hypothetical protein